MVLIFCFICEQIDFLLKNHPLTSNSIEARPPRLLIDLHYLPCLDYVSGIVQFGEVRLEAHEHYQKQSYRNRCYVLTANKVDALTVPVQQGTHHQPIRDLRIDAGQTWQMHHWRCLQAAYGKAPFFDYYAPDFELVYRKGWSFLFDLNYELLTICLKLMRLSPNVDLTEWYNKDAPVGLFDARSTVNLRNRLQPYVFHQPVSYSQNFGQNFVPNLSILDLLFCQGPAATDVLMAGLRE